jgi:hypothetical protein
MPPYSHKSKPKRKSSGKKMKKGQGGKLGYKNRYKRTGKA